MTRVCPRGVFTRDARGRAAGACTARCASIGALVEALDQAVADRAAGSAPAFASLARREIRAAIDHARRDSVVASDSASSMAESPAPDDDDGLVAMIVRARERVRARTAGCRPARRACADCPARRARARCCAARMAPPVPSCMRKSPLRPADARDLARRSGCCTPRSAMPRSPVLQHCLARPARELRCHCAGAACPAPTSRASGADSAEWCWRACRMLRAARARCARCAARAAALRPPGPAPRMATSSIELFIDVCETRIV